MKKYCQTLTIKQIIYYTNIKENTKQDFKYEQKCHIKNKKCEIKRKKHEMRMIYGIKRVRKFKLQRKNLKRQRNNITFIVLQDTCAWNRTFHNIIT